MADAFVELIDRSVAFFSELRENNTKAWYTARKDVYTSEIKKPAELLADVLGDELGRMTGKSMKPKLFRIHRDVRFSKDKTPYNAHLHLMWRPTTEGAPAWFFGASPDYMVVGMGLMALQGAALTQYRAMVDTQGDALTAALAKTKAGAGATISDWGPEPLKRVPKPYEPDHPQADLLKRKALAINAAPRKDWRQELIPALMAGFSGMKPVWDILDSEFG